MSFRRTTTNSREFVRQGIKSTNSLNSSWYGDKQWLWFAGVLLLAGFLRLYALERYPLPIHQDELSEIVDGYALAQTGMDRAGVSWPILTRGVGPGDYHPSLATYLTAVSTGIFGFGVAAGRLPAALLGIASLTLVWCFTRRFFGFSTACIALVLCAFSPIHLQYSRQVHAGGFLSIFFSIAVVWALARAISRLQEHGRIREGGNSLPFSVYGWWGLAGVFIGLSTTAYGALRLSALLFSVFGACLIAWECGVVQRRGFRLVRLVIILGLFVIFGASTQIYAALAMPEQFFARADRVVPPLSSGPRFWCGYMCANLATTLNPRHLFFSFSKISELSVARLSIAAFPFLYIGAVVLMFNLIRNASYAVLVLLGGTAIHLVPGVVSESVTMRVAGVWSLYPVIAATGFCATGVAIARIVSWRCNDLYAGRGVDEARVDPVKAFQSQWKSIGLVLVCSWIAIVGVANIHRYVGDAELPGRFGQYHLVELGKSLRGSRSQYDRIYVDTEGAFKYLYIAAFSGMTPQQMQLAVRKGFITKDGWEKFTRFDKFYFEPLDEAMSAWRKCHMKEKWLLVREDGTQYVLSDSTYERVALALPFKRS